MSIVIAIKYNNGVVLAADKQVTNNGHLKNTQTDKIYKSMYSNTAYGVVGRLRDLDILSCNIDDLLDYRDILDKVKLDKKYVVNKIVVQIFDLLLKYNRAYRIDNIVDIDSEILVADAYNIFSIVKDGSVLEHDKYCAIGCGEELVLGYLDSLTLNELSKTEAIDLINKCIKKTCQNDCFINDEVSMIILEQKKGR